MFSDPTPSESTASTTKPVASTPKPEPEVTSSPPPPKQLAFADNGRDNPNKPVPNPNSYKWHDFESQYTLAMEASVVVHRQAWGSEMEFLMSCIASAVGLGNIWRFPFICGQNGGGAFLLPYLLVMIFVGRPLYMMELGLGQFCSGGPVKIWEMVPGFRGVGYTATVASFFLASFYCVIMGWAILYVIYSFFPTLPWNKETFWTVDRGYVKIGKSPGAFFGLGHLGEPDVKESDTQFFRGKGLDGLPVFSVAMGLLLGWILTWSAMIFGVSGTGKIAYFLALFPYFVLFILLIGGATLPGAVDGVKFFFYPDFKKLASGRAWFQAVGQCFFSMGISFGGVIMFASFNKFHHKLGRDIIIIGIMDTFTSLLAGTVLFMIVGHIQYVDANSNTTKKRTIKDMTKDGGAGMAFVVFPDVLDAFGNYPFPNIISALFFFMIVVLAVGSANGIVGTIITVICDEFPKWDRRIVLTVFCVVSFFLGLIYTTRSGGSVIYIVDTYGSENVVYMVGLVEVIGISWVYGLRNLCNDLEFMLGYQISLYWVLSWCMLPFLLVIIFIYNFATWYNVKNHPGIALGFSWTLTVLIWLITPVSMLLIILTRKSRRFQNKVKASFNPTRKWGPADPSIREAWRRWKTTKPTEFIWTIKTLQFLRLRPLPRVTQQYVIKTMDSPYQATVTGEVTSVESTAPPTPHAVGSVTSQ